LPCIRGIAHEHRPVDARDGPVVADTILGGQQHRYRKAA
jgi:hypothetical protein